MVEIKREDLSSEEVLQEKLKACSKQIEEFREKQSALIDEQARLLREKLGEFTPIMKFMREQGINFTHPTLNYFSNIGAVLDYDNSENELYVYDFRSGWIKSLNLYNQKTKDINDFEFIERRNLENAISGLNYLLNFQEKVTKEFSNDIAERKKWIEEMSEGK